MQHPTRVCYVRTMAMNDAYEEGRIKKGDLMLLDTFGGGFTWASALVHFGGQ